MTDYRENQKFQLVGVAFHFVVGVLLSLVLSPGLEFKAAN